MNEDFWCHVLRSSDKAESFVLVFNHFFASSHVNQLQVPISPHHDVLGLQVTVDDALGMEDFHNVDEKSNIEASLLEREDSNGTNHVEKVLSFNVLCQEVDVEVILEGAVVLDDKRGVFQGNLVKSLLLLLSSKNSTLMKVMCLCLVRGFFEMHFKAK